MLRKCPFRRESESILRFCCEPARQSRLSTSVDAVGLGPIWQLSMSNRSNRTAAAPFQAAARRPAAKCQVILARALNVIH